MTTAITISSTPKTGYSLPMSWSIGRTVEAMKYSRIRNIQKLSDMPVISTRRSPALLAKVAETITIRKIIRNRMGYLTHFPRYLGISPVTDAPPWRMDIMPDM